MTNIHTIEPDTAAPETEDTEPAEAAILSEIDLYLLAKPIAEALGDGWSEDPDDNPAGFVDKVIRLIHPDGRAIGIRHLWQGEAVSTFAIGGPAPKKSAGTDQASENRLPKGVRYSTGVHFTSASPLEEILTAIRTVLLPAFDGYRPRLRADGTRITALVEPPAEQSEAPKANTAQPVQEASTASSAAKTNAKPQSKKKVKPQPKAKVKSTGRRATTAKRTNKRRTTASAAA
ncbi:hypothetical protein ACO0M4_11910 [Streptomyces sp. RGM 3693]|uniref:hypothetical protein n=1 Tax=Streptomyces sp. RGM 3693 TaxID=3413284 RepID=UPI003D2DDE8B